MLLCNKARNVNLRVFNGIKCIMYSLDQKNKDDEVIITQEKTMRRGG